MSSFVKVCWVIAISLVINEINATQDRRSSLPFITGDGFREICTFVVDDFEHLDFSAKVRNRDAIFVKTDYLDTFFSLIHPCIQAPYILVTHNSDLSIPGPFLGFLDDPQLIGWYGQNVDTKPHAKLHPIPIGLGNRYTSVGKQFEKILSEQSKSQFRSKTTLLYLNFAIGTYPKVRAPLFEKFASRSYCKVTKKTSYEIYLSEIAESKFVLAPRGNGYDCHRIWEVMLLGSIPVVKSSPLDPLFDELPVLIIKDWDEISEEWLEEKWVEMSKKEFAVEKLYMDYWTKLILGNHS